MGRTAVSLKRARAFARATLAIVVTMVSGCAGPSAEPAAGEGSAKSAGRTASRVPVPDLTPSGPALDHAVTTIDGESVSMDRFRGKAVLIVNTASECGYTPQYEGLQALHDRFNARGFAVLGFPCNDFGGQEPGSEGDIKKFCTERFNVTFPMFSKVHAKGPEQHPLYATLTGETRPGVKGPVEWNFTKFLVNPEGRVVARWNSKVEPLDPEVVASVEAVLPTG